MAAATTIAGLGMGALQTGMGIAQQSKAKKDLRNLEVPELNNAFEDIPISTLGSDLIREESARTTATLVDAAKAGGTRTVYSALPKIVSLNNKQNNEASLYLDDQVNKRNYNIAQDDIRIRGIKEGRYQGEVQGLGQQMMVGQQNMWSGMRGMANAFMYADRQNNLEEDTE